jgi:hypothetical protein
VESPCDAGACAQRSARRSLFSGFCAGRRGIRRLGALRQINLTAKDSIVFDRQPKSTNVPFNNASSAEFDTAAGYDVALHVSLNEYIASREIGSNVCVRANGEAALGESYGSLDAPVYDQIFSTLYFATNDDGFANPSRTIIGCHGLIPSRISKSWSAQQSAY